MACFVTPNHGFLESWARQGVLLLNTVRRRSRRAWRTLLTPLGGALLIRVI